MRCELHEEQLSSLIDNELEEEDSESLFRHMSGCPDCRRSFRLALQMRADLREDVPPMAPRELDAKVLTAVRTAKRYLVDRKSVASLMWNRRISMPLPIAAAAVVVLIAAGITLSLLSSRLERMPLETKVQTVYVTTLSPVEVQGYFP